MFLYRLFAKKYEDWSAERITGYNFNMLSQKYQAEQSELIDKIDRLKTELKRSWCMRRLSTRTVCGSRKSRFTTVSSAK